MLVNSGLFLVTGGFVTGCLAGLLGIGGGVILVPLLITLGYTPIEVVATSSLAIFITAIAGSVQNWKMGCLNLRQVMTLGLPALIAAQVGVYIAIRIEPHVILFLFGGFLLANIYLIDYRKRLVKRSTNKMSPQSPSFQGLGPLTADLVVGGVAGLLTGVLGVGGGIVMITLQMLFLNKPIKAAIQTSLGVLVLVTLSACIVHATAGNLLVVPGLILGVSSLLGVRLSTYCLPKIPDAVITQIFRLFLLVMSLYVFWQAYHLLTQSVIEVGVGR